MFKRKLAALEHANPESFNIDDDTSVRNLVVWLEDHKIRHYKIEHRTQLKKITSPNWNGTFKTYLKDLACPFDKDDVKASIDWLLALAVQLEHGEDVEKYSKQTAKEVTELRASEPQMVNANPLDTIDFTSPEFKDGVNSVADLLEIPKHPDHLITLKAISHVITTRMSAETIKSPGEYIQQGKPYPIFSADLGFEMGDKNLNNAGKVLRLLYIQDLRQLQTSINECIAVTQTVTANPKTDSRLGKVGR